MMHPINQTNSVNSTPWLLLASEGLLMFTGRWLWLYQFNKQCNMTHGT